MLSKAVFAFLSPGRNWAMGVARNFEKPISIPFPFIQKKKSRVRLFSRGERPPGITRIAWTRLKTRAKIPNPDISALCTDRSSLPLLIFFFLFLYQSKFLVSLSSNQCDVLFILCYVIPVFIKIWYIKVMKLIELY